MAAVKKIMVAVDESEFSLYALEWTLNNLHLHADEKNVCLFVFHVLPYLAMTCPGTMGVTRKYMINFSLIWFFIMFSVLSK